VRLIVRGDEEPIVEAFAEQATEKFRAALEGKNEQQKIPHRILGPAPCPIARLRGKYRFHALLSSADGEQLRQRVGVVAAALEPPAEVQWVLDVDPLDLL
jgi:primosomal protein N' (replication factor Y)